MHYALLSSSACVAPSSPSQKVAIGHAKFELQPSSQPSSQSSLQASLQPPLQPSPQQSSHPSLSKQLSSQPPSQPPWSCSQNKIHLCSMSSSMSRTLQDIVQDQVTMLSLLLYNLSIVVALHVASYLGVSQHLHHYTESNNRHYTDWDYIWELVLIVITIWLVPRVKKW